MKVLKLLTGGRRLLTLMSMLPLIPACGDQRPDAPLPITQELQGQSSAQNAADRAAEKLKSVTSKVNDLKMRLQILPPEEDNAERKAALEELRVASTLLHSLIQGAGGMPAGARGATPATAPLAGYQKLRERMKDFDMSKASDVAAWSELKRKELGQ